MSYKWTDKETEVLIKMINARKTLKDISLVLKSKTSEAIRNKSDRMGMKFSRDVEIDMDAFNKLMKGK